MARERGTFNFSANLEIKKQGALDSRIVIQTYDELKSSSTWADTEGKVWLYKGMVVSVINDGGGRNGLYMLIDADGYTNDAAWQRIDAGAAEKTEIIDNLTSNKTTAALSANQGRVLDEKITAVDDKVDEFIATKNQPNGFAGLDEEGKIPVSLLNGQQAHVQGVDAVATSSTLPETSSLPAEYMVWCTDDKKLREWSGSEWDVIDPIGDTIYNFRNSDVTGSPDRTNILYRWDGSTMVEISSSLALGETAGTAYEGSKGKATTDSLNSHLADHNNPHEVTKEQVGLGNVENLAPADLPVSTAVQESLDTKVDKIEGSSLVPDTEITKLAGLKSQSEITSDINEVQSNVDSLGTKVTNITGESTNTYVANDSANYISDATSLKDADNKLDAQVKINTDAIEALTGDGSGSVSDQIQTAIDGIVGGATEDYNTLKELEDAVKAEEQARLQGDQTLTTNLGALDTAVSAFKNKTVSTTLASPGNNTSLPTTKAVVDYITEATNGVANDMTYTQKDGDPTKMELKLIAVDGSTLSTIELDKENFISNFQKKTAEEADHTADGSIEVGDPILVVTTVNGQVFRVNLKDLVDIYNGSSTNSITVNVSGYTVSADLKLDSGTQNNNAVKLTVGSNGLSADIQLNTSTNGTKGVVLSKSGSGLAAELKIDATTNTANGVSMVVGEKGLSASLVWVEL